MIWPFDWNKKTMPKIHEEYKMGWKSIVMDGIDHRHAIGHKEMWLHWCHPFTTFKFHPHGEILLCHQGHTHFMFHPYVQLHPRYSIIYLTDYTISTNCCEFVQICYFHLYCGFLCCFKYQYGTNSIHVLVFTHAVQLFLHKYHHISEMWSISSMLKISLT
jgi:hypothetical protein